MSCQGCTQKIIEQNAEENATILEAAKKAAASGTYYGIYRDERGTVRYATADSLGYPFYRYISPRMLDA